MKTYPTNAHILIADDIRMEEGGKPSLLGVYVGNNIHFTLAPNSPANVRPALPLLAIYAMFNDGEGDFVGRIDFVSPSGLVITSSGPVPVHKDPQLPMVVGWKIAPAQFPEFGSYTIRVNLDDTPYTQPFLAIEVPAAATNVPSNTETATNDAQTSRTG